MTRVLSVILLGAATAGLIRAQPDELATLREEYEKSVFAAAKMVDDAFKLTLARLEKQRAEQGDYEGALRAQERAEAAGKSPPSFAPAARSGYVLTASQARTQGALFDRLKGILEFRKAGAAASWEILRLDPATYQVFAVYAVGAPVLDPSTSSTLSVCGGSFSCKEVTSLGNTVAPLEKAISTTGSWENYVRASLGSCSFKSKSATLRIEALNALPGGLMRLARIELIPVSDASMLNTVGGQDAAELLRELRRDHRASLAAAIGPVQTRFRADFEKLAAELARQGDSENASAVIRETKRWFPEGVEPTPLEGP
ncbi:MAG: hypothetical protein ACR2OZ_02985 [Verrucomicrobiales bacterium]